VVLIGMNIVYASCAYPFGKLAAMVANTAPADLRGTGYGFFNLLSGLAMRIASGLAGWLWQSFGAATTFMAGIGFAALALLLLVMRPKG
jgi:sugar phosphate permease